MRPDSKQIKSSHFIFDSMYLADIYKTNIMIFFNNF